MQAALRALNQLVACHVIERYAIGGAIGASFCIEATQTEDIDVFVFLAPSASGLLSLTPVYDTLVALGGSIERESRDNDMESDLDQRKAAHIIAAKASFRAAERSQTWEQRVQAIARMNAASKLAKAGMMKSTKSAKRGNQA